MKNNDGYKRLSVAVLVLLALPTTARASAFGEENAALVALVAQGIEEIAQASETIATLKQTYDQVAATYEQAKKYVGMAQDAVDGFNEFQSFATGVFTKPDQALYSLFPDAQTLRGDLASPQNWARGTGELQRLIRVCLAGGGKCAEFHEAVTARMAADAIKGTYGTSPIARDDVNAVDVEAADAISQSTLIKGTSSISEVQARALQEKCIKGTGAAAVSACQAAANLGALLSAEELAKMNQQMAEANRLTAVGLAMENETRKREIAETLQRNSAIEAAAKQSAPQRVRYHGALDTNVSAGGLQ